MKDTGRSDVSDANGRTIEEASKSKDVDGEKVVKKDEDEPKPDPDTVKLDPTSENNPNDDTLKPEIDSEKPSDEVKHIPDSDNQNKGDIKEECDANDPTKCLSPESIEVGHTTVQNTETGEEIKLVLKVEKDKDDKAIAELDNEHVQGNTDGVKVQSTSDSTDTDENGSVPTQTTVTADISTDRLHIKHGVGEIVKDFKLSTDCVLRLSHVAKKHTGLKGKPRNPPRRRTVHSEQTKIVKADSTNVELAKENIESEIESDKVLDDETKVVVESEKPNDTEMEFKPDEELLDPNNTPLESSSVNGGQPKADDKSLEANNAETKSKNPKEEEETQDDKVEPVDPTKSEVHDTSNPGPKQSKVVPEKRKISAATQKKRLERKKAIKSGKFEVEKVAIVDLLTSDEEQVLYELLITC